MKKTRIFAVIALAALAAACAKEKDLDINQEIIPSGPNTIVFKALAPTRTAIDENDEAVTWVAGDEVKFVWDGGSANATASSSGASTTFYVEVPEEGIDEIYAVYPADAGGSYAEGKVNVHYNGTRTDGSFAANSICVARAVKEGEAWSTTLAFKNVACLLKVGVATTDIVKLQVKGIGEEAISGAVPVNIDDSGEPVFGTAASTGTSVSMAVSGPGDYYIPVMPGVTLSDGFRVNLFTDEETQTTPFFYYGSFTTERGKILKMNDIEAHAGQYYVTPAGAGTKSGQSWNNAMDAAKFKAFVENQDNHFLLKGSTFHFSAEEFSFGDDYLKPAYPDHANVAFTLEGTVTASDTTTFLGRTATSGTTAGVLWPQQNSYITVKNVKFTGTNGASNASPIRINNSAKSLTLDHCYFRNNKTSGNGGAISHFNSATLTIKDCSFSDNTGAGGLIHVNNASAKVFIEDTEVKCITKNAIFGENFDTFTLTRVTFKDNDDAGEYGAAAYVRGNGTISFNDCKFIRNHSTVQGGAVCINGDGVTTTFTDCDFIDNWSDKKAGAVMIESGNTHTTFTGGKFQGNHADGADDSNAAGGAIYATGAVDFSCTNVLFKENYNYIGENLKSGGILRIQSEGGIARFNGCTFDGNYTNRENSNNASCAAIVNGRVGGVKYYFNACEFLKNTSGTGNSAGVYGGLNGTLFAIWAGVTIAMNNCSMHDNYGGRNSDNIHWIHMGNANSKLIVSNSTIVGDRVRPGGTVKNYKGVIFLENSPKAYLINSILCSYTYGGSCVGCSAAYDVSSYYCKTSPELDSDTVWSPNTGSGHDYYARSASFGGWTDPYTWNGTLTGTNSDMLAETADVNAEINDTDPDFYAWLTSIGALGKDIAGRNRGETSWPGCYQN